MNSSAAIAAPSVPHKQPVWQRLVFFVIGGVVSYLLISTPLGYLTRHYPGMPDIAKSGLSVAVSSIPFFFWNYFINFRTGSGKRVAFARFAVATCMLWALQSLTLWLLRTHDPSPYVQIFKWHINRDVVGTQLCLGGFKFLIYHYWAFPAHKEK